jgi:hypothetical protein
LASWPPPWVDLCRLAFLGADMQVHLVNDGPVTLMIDSKAPE